MKIGDLVTFNDYFEILNIQGDNAIVDIYDTPVRISMYKLIEAPKDEKET